MHARTPARLGQPNVTDGEFAFDSIHTAVYTERYTDDDIYRPIPIYIPANDDENKNTDSHETNDVAGLIQCSDERLQSDRVTELITVQTCKRRHSPRRSKPAQTSPNLLANSVSKRTRAEYSLPPPGDPEQPRGWPCLPEATQKRQSQSSRSGRQMSFSVMMQLAADECFLGRV